MSAILNPMNTPFGFQQIPSSARPFFQEYNVDLLDLEQHAALIIERILAYGNRAEVRWLLDRYGRNDVHDWVERSGRDRLSQRRYHLWCFVFQLPEKDAPDRIWPH
jgi:hypothetical protein